MPSPQPYRSRRGVDVQAMQWRPDDASALAAAVGWLMALHYVPTVWEDFVTAGDLVIEWRDRRGTHTVEPGGWLVRVAGGSLYGFDGDAFAAEFVVGSEVAG